MIKSPLNYIGGKHKLLPQIYPHFPNDIEVFLDLFCGGCNVGINSTANKVIYNDINKSLEGLYTIFSKYDIEDILSSIDKIINKYNLSKSSVYGYKFYDCDSAKGLGHYNKESFLELRKDFNSRKRKDYYYYIMLYVLVVYSFNNQLRFNSKGEFNLPVGKRDFNNNMKQKLIKFVDKLHSQDCLFTSYDYKRFPYHKLNGNDFVYVDPPYFITHAPYNENGGWTDKDERDLYECLDNLNENGIRFALSNVLESKGNVNYILKNWLESRNYNVIPLNISYNNSNYQIKDRVAVNQEILVINY